jgi:hypothetical protein
MNPETKLVLDTLSKRFDDLESRWEHTFTEAAEKLEKSFEEAEEQWESRFATSEDHWERKFADLKVAQDARVEALERVTAALEDWRPAMEGTVDDIRVEVGKISKHWERAVRERSPPILPTMPSSSTPPSSTLPASAYVLPQPSGDLQRHSLEALRISSESGRPSAADKTDRPHGHRFDNYHRADGYGSVTTLVHPPVKGACKLPSPPQSPKFC